MEKEEISDDEEPEEKVTDNAVKVASKKKPKKKIDVRIFMEISNV